MVGCLTVDHPGISRPARPGRAEEVNSTPNTNAHTTPDGRNGRGDHAAAGTTPVCATARGRERERGRGKRERERGGARESERARGGGTNRTRATGNENERLRGLRDCTGRSWRPHSFWSNLGAVRAFTLRHCPGGEKSARIQAETLPTRVRSCLSGFESAVAGGKYLSVSSGREGGPFRTRTRTTRSLFEWT